MMVTQPLSNNTDTTLHEWAMLPLVLFAMRKGNQLPIVSLIQKKALLSLEKASLFFMIKTKKAAAK